MLSCYHLRIQVLTRTGSPLSDSFTRALRTGLNIINVITFNICIITITILKMIIISAIIIILIRTGLNIINVINFNISIITILKMITISVIIILILIGTRAGLLEAQDRIGINTQFQAIHAVNKTNNH